MSDYDEMMREMENRIFRDNSLKEAQVTGSPNQALFQRLVNEQTDDLLRLKANLDALKAIDQRIYWSKGDLDDAVDARSQVPWSRFAGFTGAVGGLGLLLCVALPRIPWQMTGASLLLIGLSVGCVALKVRGDRKRADRVREIRLDLEVLLEQKDHLLNGGAVPVAPTTVELVSVDVDDDNEGAA